MMMMMMNMTLPEAMPTKMATSEPMMLEDFPPLLLSLPSLGATSGRQRQATLSEMPRRSLETILFFHLEIKLGCAHNELGPTVGLTVSECTVVCSCYEWPHSKAR